ncbi:MAG TPA: AEC family transporter [Gemmatimonadales bacterium]|nr:AEC family transporter [Gemmatimonadales bacterium]
MTGVYLKLLAIFSVVALGWIAARLRWLGGQDPTRTLASAAFYVFLPALLFRTATRVDLERLPWGTVLAFFAPVVAVLLAVYLRERRRAGQPVAAAGVRAIAATFGNTLQIGVPVATALYGETGLAVHATIISLHALTLLSLTTMLTELDLARARRQAGRTNAHLGGTLARTARQTVIHPVVLPVLAGLAWNAFLPPLPALVDETLLTLAQAAVPLCLVVIGMSLAVYGLATVTRGALAVSAVKLLAVPTLVLAVAHGALGLDGVALGVVVMAAALPVGSNAIIFAQRYQTLEAEVTGASVLSTFIYALTAPVWIAVLARLG